MDETKIRAELAETVVNDPNNIDKILKLSHQLASLDKSNVRFSVDSGVIDRLGKELVARHETAVSELVKNAYDADATKATLHFFNVDYSGGTLIIDDDGAGMTRDQLIHGFMRISSTSKIHEPVSPIFGRSRAGKRGIGRFSAQRLGNKLTIITQTKNSESAFKDCCKLGKVFIASVVSMLLCRLSRSDFFSDRKRKSAHPAHAGRKGFILKI